MPAKLCMVLKERNLNPTKICATTVVILIVVLLPLCNMLNLFSLTCHGKMKQLILILTTFGWRLMWANAGYTVESHILLG